MNRIITLVCCALFSAGLTLIKPVAEVNPLLVWLFTAGAAAVMFFISYSKFTRRLVMLFAITAAVCAYTAFGLKDVLATLYTDLAQGDIMGHGLFVSCVISLALLVFAYLMSWDEKAVYTLALTALVWAVVLRFIGGETDKIHVFPVLLALAGMYAESGSIKGAQLKALVSTGLIAVLIAVAIVPAGGATNESLRSAADRCIKLVIKTFNLDRNQLESRRSFDIGSYGWRTLYSSFGGPAYPTDGAVMRVCTDETLYLRGSVRYTYNGRAWVDESNTDKAGKIKRYMLSGIEGLLYRDEFRRAFDTDKPNALSGFQEKSASVSIISDNLYWAVYTPDRITDISFTPETSLYYNNIGELFAARQLSAGDEYAFTYYSGADMQALACECEGTYDPALADVLLLNRDVPSGSDPRLYALVEELTRGSGSGYAAAQAICSYLKDNGTYTLNPGYVPEGEDFVSWFVLEDMKGYCSYYAAAMTLMARMAGLPARYAEGYLAVPDENGECTLTGRDAHAWSEVYFNGLGWVTFDATPAGNGGDTENSRSDRNDEPEPTPVPEPELTPEPTPEPTSTPAPGFTPAPVMENTSSPEPEDSAEPDIQPDVPEDGSHPQNDIRADENGGNTHALWLLILLLPFAFIASRTASTNPSNVERRYRDNGKRLCVWYRAILTCLDSAGLSYLGGDTPILYAKKAVGLKKADEEFVDLSVLVSRIMYSGAGCSEDEVLLAKDVYYEVKRRMGIAARCTMLVKRVKNGFGSIDILP